QTGNIYRYSYTKCSQHISVSVRRRNKIPTDTNVGLAPGIQTCYSGCCAMQRKWEIQDGVRQTGSKIEVLIYQLLDQIATPFQRLTHHFLGAATPRYNANTVRCNWESAFKDGGRQTESTYISASRP